MMVYGYAMVDNKWMSKYGIRRKNEEVMDLNCLNESLYSIAMYKINSGI